LLADRVVKNNSFHQPFPIFYSTEIEKNKKNKKTRHPNQKMPPKVQKKNQPNKATNKGRKFQKKENKNSKKESDNFNKLLKLLISEKDNRRPIEQPKQVMFVGLEGILAGINYNVKNQIQLEHNIVLSFRRLQLQNLPAPIRDLSVLCVDFTGYIMQEPAQDFMSDGWLAAFRNACNGLTVYLAGLRDRNPGARMFVAVQRSDPFWKRVCLYACMRNDVMPIWFTSAEVDPNIDHVGRIKRLVRTCMRGTNGLNGAGGNIFE